MQIKSLMSTFLILTVSLLLGVTPIKTHACDFESVKFIADFPAARLDNCRLASDTHYVLSVDAENRPINNSPWYAFKVAANKAQKLNLSIDVIEGSPRYMPKVSDDGKVWENIPYQVSDGALHFSLDVDQNPVWVSAQEIITSKDFDLWLNQMSQPSKIKRIHLGKSTLGKRIDGLEITQPENNEWLILIGRQHPPEVTGTLAMLAFVEEMLTNSVLHTGFLQRFNILIVPLLNPDGVDAGYWRHNSQGVDLNRDWGKFTQVETRQVGSKLDSITQSGDKIVFALDFHSTQRDVFYTMPNDYPVAPSKFVDQWLKDLKSNVLSSFVVRNVPGKSPGRGVFKQHIADTYQVHAVTYEMGDNTSRAMITSVAKSAARTLMQALLAAPAESFYITDGEKSADSIP